MRTVINNGTIIDPKNKVYSKLNIAIEDGIITEISRCILNGDRCIDAKDLIVAPGFIDLHMHEDPYNSYEDRFEIDIFSCMLKMGVTTSIGGNCGIGTLDPDVYLDAADRLGIPVNVGLLVPHGSLRKKVNEDNRYRNATIDNIKSMKKIAENYLEKGCLGISYGIRYIPGLNEVEMKYINKSASKKQKLIAAHIRDDSYNVITAAIEFIKSGIESDVPIQLSHIGSMGAYGQMSELLSLIDDYHSNGIKIAADCYPYTAFSTHLGATTYDEGFTKRYNGGYESIEIVEGDYKGKRLNKNLFDKLRLDNPDLLTIAYVMKEDEVEMAMIHPNVIVASDGLMNKSQGHPRASSTFPRFIKQYVREKKKLNLYQAIEKITYKPAERIGIHKGSIGINDDADIVIFDYETIGDKASFTNPLLPPEGIKYVLINGEIALQDKKIMKDNLGKSIRN